MPRKNSIKPKIDPDSILLIKGFLKIIDLFNLNKKQADLILACYVNLNFLLCSALFGESSSELFKKAKNGDREAILKLIQLDKSLVESGWSLAGNWD